MEDLPVPFDQPVDHGDSRAELVDLAMATFKTLIQLMNMQGWLTGLELEIERRVGAALRRGSLTSADELIECRTAPNGERIHFSIRDIVEDGDGSQDPGWMEPA